MISEKVFIVSDNRGLSETFKEHLINIAKTLDLKPSIISTSKRFQEIIEFLKDHPSIKEVFSLLGEESVSSSFIL